MRPLRHDQYERFIPAAYPYYAAAFSVRARPPGGAVRGIARAPLTEARWEVRVMS